MSSFFIDKFYGRKDSLDLLKKRVVDLKEGYRQNIAFIGEQYIGKSYILQKFVADLDDNDIIFVYLELKDKDFSCFCDKFIGSILYNYSKSKNLPLYDNINLLIGSTKKLIPLSAELISKIQSNISNGKVLDAYRDLISLSQVFSKETNMFCVLVLDEFQELEEFGIPDVFKELGEKIMTQKRCLYIVSSSSQGIAMKILSEKLSLLFGNFEVIHVGPFDLKTSQEYIQFHLSDLSIGENLRNFFIDFTGGHPLYLRIICQELINLSAIHQQKNIYQPLLIQAIDNVLFNSWGILSRHFDILIKQTCSGKGNYLIGHILISLSNKKYKIKELAKDLKVKQNQVSQRINKLCDTGVVYKNGSFYYIKDKLFKYWLKYIFQKRQNAVGLFDEKQKEQFYLEVSNAIEGFCVNSKKDISSRIIDLLYCFEDEVFHSNGRRYKLPIFQGIESGKVRRLSGDGHFDVIKASSDQGYWYIVLKPEIVSEDDVSAVITETKKFNQKPQRCILIALSDLDENARIKALQEKMWIWNEGELNTLLNLYNKPFIVQ